MYRSNRPFVFLALAAALAASACNRPDDTDQTAAAANSAAPLPTLPATLPMATGPATSAGYAPAAAALPAARPIRTVRLADPRDSYAYADDAYAFSNALGDAPPDYGFDYGGAEPWAWQGYDESRVFMEPVPNGYRYYYYRPGADEPYFVRDPDYGYGYDNGALAVIYAATGAVLPFADYGPRLGYASRYLARGEALYDASRANERRAVIAANWAARQDAIAASRDRWAAAQARQAGWQAYRARVADQQARHWAEESQRRDADARRFATWHNDGFQGPPPPRAIPAAWQQAPWARNVQDYRPARQQFAEPQRQAFAGDNDPRGRFDNTPNAIDPRQFSYGLAQQPDRAGFDPRRQQFAGAAVAAGAAGAGAVVAARAFNASRGRGERDAPPQDGASHRSGPGQTMRNDREGGPRRGAVAPNERAPNAAVQIHRGADAGPNAGHFDRGPREGGQGRAPAQYGDHAPPAARQAAPEMRQQRAPAAAHMDAPRMEAPRSEAPRSAPHMDAPRAAPRAEPPRAAPQQHAAPAPHQGGGGQPHDHR